MTLTSQARPSNGDATVYSTTTRAARSGKCEAKDPLTCPHHGIPGNPWMADMLRSCEEAPNHIGHKIRLATIAEKIGLQKVLAEAYQDRIDYVRFVGESAAVQSLNNLELQTAIFRTLARSGRPLYDPRKKQLNNQQTVPTTTWDHKPEADVRRSSAEARAERARYLREHLAYDADYDVCEACGKLRYPTTQSAARHSSKLFRRDPRMTAIYAYRCDHGKGFHTTRWSTYNGHELTELKVSYS